MYFFLSNLFFVDICFISMSIPKMLWNVQIKSKAKPMKTASASYTFCCSFSFGLLSPKCSGPWLVCSHLSALGLHSHHDPQLCGLLLLVGWLLSVLNSLLTGLLVLQLSFCADMIIPHFFRESNQVLQHTCSDNFLNHLVLYFASGLVSFISFTSTLFFFSKILFSMLRISSVRSKYKAFSTHGSHISIVSLFYGTRLEM